MSISFATHPSFLRVHFPQTRRRLRGKSQAASRMQQRLHPGLKYAVTILLSGVLISSIVLMGVLVIPEAVARLKSAAGEQAFMQAAFEKQEHNRAPVVVEATPIPTPTPTPLPLQDPTLPTEDWIYIPSIGVDSQMRATIDPDEALDQGVWLVPDFGRPEENEDPIIVAAHRFGWDWWWQSDFGKKNSFYSLTELQPGDRVELVSDQRKYVYEIYAGEEGTEITDYSADLILYTCKFLNSPIRYFKYAQRVEQV